MPRSWGMPMLTALALALTTGCIYITPKEGEEKRASLDQDEDGAKLGDDCNDEDPLRFPGNAEIAYDGIDQDCDPLLQDLLDIDDDGYAGIDRSEYEAAHPDAPEWPDGLVEDKVDCDDAVASVYPGAVDSWYDGVDADCAGNDDYDQDGDEYVPDAYAASSSLDAGDCDDTRADVNPGVTTDAWYDGIDEDCAKNNDFDADDDMYMPTSTSTLTAAQLQKAYTDYASYYGYDYQTFYGVTSEALYGDCQDQADGTRADIVPELVYPTADDAWYDGIDSNCDTINDFDADADAYIRDVDTAAYDTWLEYWEYEDDTLGANDCDDADAAVHPGTLEALADGIDQDCDGGVDTSPWTDGGYDWDDVRPIVVGKNDLHYVLTTAAGGSNASAFKVSPALSLAFPLDAGFGDKPDSVVVWQNNTTAPRELGETIDMVMGTDSFYVATQYFSPETSVADPQIYLIGKWVQWSSSSAGYGSKLAYNGINTANSGEQFYNDVDMQPEVGTGKYWVFGCGDESISFLRVDPLSTPSTWSKDSFGCDADSTGCQQYTGVAGQTCWLDVSGTSAVGHVCAHGSCTSYQFDGGTSELITLEATQPYASETWTSVNRAGDWLVAVDVDGTVYVSDGASSYTLFADGAYDALYAEVAEDSSGQLYVSAVVDDADGDGFEDVVLAYGDPSAAMTYVTVPVSDGETTWHAEYAAVHVDDDRVMLAATGYYGGDCGDASGYCDMVGWAFFEAP